MKPATLLAFLTITFISATYSQAQGVIGGNQNGLGDGGYLPKPPTTGEPNENDSASPIVTSLGMPG